VDHKEREGLTAYARRLCQDSKDLRALSRMLRANSNRARPSAVPPILSHANSQDEGDSVSHDPYGEP
jgi:hypothetical protein